MPDRRAVRPCLGGDARGDAAAGRSRRQKHRRCPGTRRPRRAIASRSTAEGLCRGPCRNEYRAEIDAPCLHLASVSNTLSNMKRMARAQIERNATTGNGLDPATTRPNMPVPRWRPRLRHSSGVSIRRRANGKKERKYHGIGMHPGCWASLLRVDSKRRRWHRLPESLDGEHDAYQSLMNFIIQTTLSSGDAG